MASTIENMNEYSDFVRKAILDGEFGKKVEALDIAPLDQLPYLVEGKGKIYRVKIKFWKLFEFISALGIAVSSSSISPPLAIFIAIWVLSSLKEIGQVLSLENYTDNYYQILKKLHDTGLSISKKELAVTLSLDLSEVEAICENLWKCEVLSEDEDGYYIVDSFIELIGSNHS